MRIFFTGATGVIGRRAIPLCLVRGHEVTAVGALGGECRWTSSAGSSRSRQGRACPRDHVAPSARSLARSASPPAVRHAPRGTPERTNQSKEFLTEGVSHRAYGQPGRHTR